MAPILPFQAACSAAGREFRCQRRWRRLSFAPVGENETKEAAIWRWLGPCLVIVLCLASARLRYTIALDDPAYDGARPESVLRSDPALLYALTKSVVEAGGTPEDWRADPRLAWPETVDVPATYTVGQEYLVLAARRVFGDSMPLHALVIALGSLTAALAGAGVYWIGFELTGSARLGLLGAILHGTLPAAYRSLGFVIVREDLALPLFALHLALALRAARVGGPLAWGLAGLSLGSVLATWHAGGLLATALIGVLGAGVTLGLRNPLASRGAPVGWAALVAVCLAVPALRAKDAIFDLPVLVSGLLVVLPRVAPARARFLFTGLGAAVVLLRLFVLPSVDMGHVGRMLMAKLVFAGVPPTDPDVLDFEARMMWQGPFATLWLGGFWGFFRLVLLFLPFVLLGSLRIPREQRAPGELFLTGLLAAGLVLAFLAQRMVVLPALVSGPLLALAARRATRVSQPPFGALGVGALVFFQCLLFAGWISRPALPWTNVARGEATAHLTDAVDKLVPAGEAIAADFLLNPVLLGTTGHPMVLQPKWEQRSARERVRAVWMALYGGTSEDLAELLEGSYDCRWLAVDRQVLGALPASLFLGGRRAGEGLAPGSAALALCGGEGRDVPGFEFVWESPRKGDIPGLYRLYRVRR